MAAPQIDPANTWVTSDSHFGHQNIVGYCHRPTDHEQILMEEWALAVPEDGTILHLGDLVWKSNGLFKHVISKHLPGSPKYLILGNHDRQRPSFYRECGFRVIKPFELYYDPSADRPGDLAKRFIVSFSHYPLRGTPHMLRSVERSRQRIHIHGHIHNNGYGGKSNQYTPFSAGQINISAEQTHYRPVNLKALLDGYILGCYEPEHENEGKRFIGDDPVLRDGLEPPTLPASTASSTN